MTVSVTPAPSRAEELRAKALAKIDEAKAIADTADAGRRDFTPAERAKVKALFDEAKALKADADEAAQDADMRRAFSDFAGTLAANRSHAAKGTTWGAAVRRHFGGAKTVTPSGSIQVPSISSTIATTPGRPRSVLQLIPTKTEGGELFSYLREVTKDHQASTVRAGQPKPRSLYGIEKIDDRVRTIAHLSDPIDRALLSDVELVESYIDGVLREGCELELERQVLNGDADTSGVLDDLTGVLQVSGHQVQTFATDVFTTTRKAVTKLENLELDPAGFAWVMSPTAWESLELETTDEHYVLSSAGGTTDRLPLNRAERKLWGIKVVPTTAMADAGDEVAVLGDFGGSLVLHEREGVTIEWSEAVQVDPGESGGATYSAFEVNQRVYRGEMRAGLEIARPAAFVEVDLTS